MGDKQTNNRTLKYKRQELLQKISNTSKSSIISMRIHKYGISFKSPANARISESVYSWTYPTQMKVGHFGLPSVIKYALPSLRHWNTMESCQKIARGNRKQNAWEYQVINRDTMWHQHQNDCTIDLLSSTCHRGKGYVEYNTKTIKSNSSGVIMVRLMRRCTAVISDTITITNKAYLWEIVVEWQLAQVGFADNTFGLWWKQCF